MQKSCLSRPFLFLAASLISATLYFPKPTFAESSTHTAPSVSERFLNIQEITLTAGEKTKKFTLSDISPWFSVETTLGFHSGYRSEIENSRLCPLSDYFCIFAIPQQTRNSLRHHATLTLNPDAVRASLQEFDKIIRKEPVDAKFTVEDGKVSAFVLSEEGIQLDIEAGLKKITKALTSTPGEAAPTLELPTLTIAPTVQSNDAKKLGITELIGEGRSNFAGSPKNRIHNFKRAMEQFHGILIPPGSEFSFVELLGPVDGESGYLPELVIKHNRTEPEFGGGICQVSSTIFRAAIYSGLKITARRNHAYPVKYYQPYGMDATIYIPNPDFRFINNTQKHILVQGSIEGTELIFRFYGTSDGRKVEVDGPYILESNPDGSMKTIFTQKVTDSEGKTLIEDAFRSNYASPSKYPHPDEQPLLQSKPKDWSGKQWEEYKKANNIL
jgi:vancomycin resistance protein YoaR